MVKNTFPLSKVYHILKLGTSIGWPCTFTFIFASDNCLYLCQIDALEACMP